MHTKSTYSTPRNAGWQRSAVIALLLLLGLLVARQPVVAQGVSPFIYYVPLPEDQIKATYDTIQTNSSTYEATTFIIAGVNGTVITYDHWEDGYEANIASPVQASTRIYGDGNTANGNADTYCSASCAGDIVNAGDVLVMEVNQTLTIPRNPSQIKFDGRDKWATNYPVTGGRAYWPTDAGPLMAEAAQFYATSDYGTTFVMPIGENVSAYSYEAFERVAAFIMAGSNQTKCTYNGGTFATLNEGQSVRRANVQTGDSVVCDKPVQVHLLTGDTGSKYEGRAFEAFPRNTWTNSYFDPVGTTNTKYPSVNYVYNPHATNLTVLAETRFGTTNLTVAPNNVVRYVKPDSAVRLYSNDGRDFYALNVNDAATVQTDGRKNETYDWGHPLIPEGLLTTMTVSGWSPGSDDGSPPNAGPVWVTALANTTLYIDYDADPATGANTDSNGNKYDTTQPLARLQSLRIYDTADNDQTGLRLYTLDGVKISAAWGEDGSRANVARPNIDAGTVSLPFPVPSLNKSVALANDVDGDGRYDVGDTARYSIVVRNAGGRVLTGVRLEDTLPAGVTYVANSTTLDGAAVADDAGAFPLLPANGGLALPNPTQPPGTVPAGAQYVIEFRVTINPSAAGKVLTNTAFLFTDQEDLRSSVDITVPPSTITQCTLDFTDGAGASVSFLLENGLLYVTVTDADKNLNSGVQETLGVVVRNLDGGDEESLLLTEISANSGVFRNSTGLPTAPDGGAAPQDGTMNARAGQTLQADYTDALFGDTCNDTLLIAGPTQTKVLYLSEPGQAMDRIDPVATNDTSTSLSAVFGGGGGGGGVVVAATTKTTGAVSTSGGNVTFSHTPGTGSDLLLVAVGAGANGPGEGGNVTGVTFGGTAMTQVGYIRNNDSEAAIKVYLFALANPADAAANVVVTVGADSDGTTIAAGATTFTDVDVSNGLTSALRTGGGVNSAVVAPTGLPNASSPASSGSASVPSVINDLVFSIGAWDEDGTNQGISPGSGQSELWTSSGFNYVSAAASAKSASGSSTTVSYSAFNSQEWGIVGVSIKPASGGSGAASPTVYYEFEDNTNDSGGLNHGTASGSPTYTTGKTGKSINLDGVNDHVVLPTGMLNSFSDITVAAWVYWDDTTTTDWERIFDFGDDVNRYMFLTPSSSTNRLRFAITTSGSGNEQILESASALPTSQWTHVAVTLNGNTGTLYVNGVAVDTGTITLDPSNITPSEAYIGRSHFAVDPYFDGRIDEFRVYNTALSAAEISALVSGSGSVGVVTTGATNSSATSSASSLSFSHSPGSGDNRLLLVAVEVGDDYYNGGSPGTVTSVKYGGTALTEVGNVSNGAVRSYIYRLVDPAPGPATVEVFVSSRSSIVAGATTFNGVDQTTPLGAYASNSNNSGSSGSVTLSSASGELVFSTGGWDEGSFNQSISIGSGQSELWKRSGQNYVSAAASTKPGAASVTVSYSAGDSQEWVIGAVPINPAANNNEGGGAVNTSVMFVQTPPMASNFVMPAGGVVTVTAYISASGVLPASPDITATLKSGGSVFATLTNPTATALGGGKYRLNWSGALAANAAVPAGQQVVLKLTSGEATSTQVLYDSSTYPSKVKLPTNTVINVDELAFYDAPYPGGSLVTETSPGQTLYIRAKVSDPFGAYDITGATLNISGTIVTLDDNDVVASDDASKTYEYAWTVPLGTCNDTYPVTITANEGFEDITATAQAEILSICDDFGTPCSAHFLSALGGAIVTTFNGGDTVYMRVVDLDQNLNPAVAETVVVTVNGVSYTLTETGVNSGVFEGTDSTIAAGQTAQLVYVDPNTVLPGADVCTSDAYAPQTNNPAISISKRRTEPPTGPAIVGDVVRFELVVINTGNTILNPVVVADSYDSTKLQFTSANPAPTSSSAGSLSWNNLGPLEDGESSTIEVVFRAIGAAAPTVNNATVTGTPPSGPNVTDSASADVTIIGPDLELSKTTITPANRQAKVGEAVTFRVVITNAGDSVIDVLPLVDNFDVYCLSFISASPAPNALGSGVLFWQDLTQSFSQNLGVGQRFTIDVTLRALEVCDPAMNTAFVEFARDVNGNPTTPVSDDDYVQTSAAYDFGDAPDSYGTLLASSGARHGLSLYRPLNLGAIAPDADSNGQPTANADGDDLNGAAPDDEESLTSLPMLITGGSSYSLSNIPLSNGSGVTATLYGWVDFNADGRFQASEFASAVVPYGATSASLSWSGVSITQTAGVATYIRLRLTTDALTDNGGTPLDERALGLASNGEVEDYLVQVQAPGIVIEKTTNGASADFADGPDVQQIVPGATVTWQYLVTNNGTLNIARNTIQVSDNVVGNLMVNGVVQTLASPYTGVTLVSNTSLADNVLQPNESFTLQVTRAAESLNAIDPNASGSDQYVLGCKDPTTNPTGRTTYKNTGVVTVPGATDSDDSHYCNQANSGAIGDFVWYDSNKDGIQDVGEPGIPNVTLDLYKDTDGTSGLNTATDTKVKSTVTDADGGYLFRGLEPGSYFVDVTDIGNKLAGLTHIVANQSQNDPTPAIVLTSGQVYKDADFGYVDNSPGKAIVGDTVWFDDNGDGIQQPSEPGIPNVTVNIRNSSGTIIGSDDTDTNGHYLVKVDPGNGYTAAPDPADIPPGLTATTPVPHLLPLLSAGDQYLDADFGYNDGGNLLGTIGNLVFEDKNNNGVFNGSPEVGMPGVSVDLIRDANGNRAWESGEPVIATVTTDKDGGYLFTGLPSDNYLVHVSDTNGVLLNHNKSNLGTAGADNNNQVDPYAIPLVAGADNLTADFGYVKIDPSLGQIGNQVWVESDGNGLFNPTGSDVGQAGVTVRLYRNGSPYATTTTGASGDYLFTKLPSGTYTVTVSDSFAVLDDWIVTTLGPNQGSEDNNQQQPYQIVLPTGGENLTADFGYTRPSAIGDFVWYDADKDGIEDVGEPGIPNVTLNLYRDKDGSGTISLGDPLIGTKVTDADGGYLFPGLVAGDYIVDVTDTNNKLTGLTQIVANQAKPDPTAKITLGAGVKYEDADFGYVKNPTGSKAIIGDTVWYDDNGDGVQQPNEPGIPGIQVCATPVGGGAAVCNTTNDNGIYRVEVDPGSYNVAPTNPPSGYTATTPVPHGPVKVDAGEQYLDADFGYNDNGTLLGKAGNLVFVEAKASRDGIYNGSDKPLGGVSISLIRDSNGNKVWDAGEPIIATTTTAGAIDATFGSNGNYLFTGLVAGNYLVHVSDTNAVLLDYNRTILGPNQGSDNNNQKDPYGFTLTAGGQNLTADFGYYRTERPDVGVIGNQVWTEKDGDGLYNVNSGDVGQPGVTVELIKDGVLYDTTTTGPSGDYSFVGLPAGNYTTRVTDSLNVLAGHRVTQLGPIQSSDNNNQLQPYTVVLPKDGVNLTADFGYILPAAIGDFVYYDTNKDGIQDVGEPGIPNVAVGLYRDTNNNGVLNIGTDEKIASTVTDRDGGYLFPNLVPGKYIVDVTDASNPNGNLGTLTHTLGNQSATDPTPVITLVGGKVYKDADFGYVQPTDPGEALIGDTVWYDANGDGVQQPEEPGIPGITVRATDASGLTYNSVTDGTGIYHIEVPQGTYTVTVVNPPAGLTVTTDQTWGPTVMVAGQQRLDADFGYTALNVFGTIGNLVFWDKDRDGIYNNSDVALGGVSVDLIRDTNGNKAWDTGEPIIATATTKTALDGNTGNYLFTGLVAGNYLVHVSDTNAVLFDFEKSVLGSNQTANNHNKADPYAITLGAAQNNLTADFGYYRRPNQPKVGVIGNQIWLETDLNGLFDVLSIDVGQAGVTVDLYEGGVKLATTTSGASGDYSFVHLPSGTYTVAVSDNQGVLTGLDVTVLGPSQGSDNNNQAQPYTVNLPLGGVNLTADFGYKDGGGTGQGSAQIGNSVWSDVNNNGVLDSGEKAIGNVVVKLWLDLNGNCVLDTNTNPDLLVGSRTTGSNLAIGNTNYLFEYPDGLPSGNYLVQVTDPNSALVGATKSNAQVPGADNNSQVTPYCIQNFNPTGAGDINLTADFGYLLPPSSFTLTKTTITPSPVRPGTTISFSIRITNTGSTWLMKLPLIDTYDKEYIGYLSAVPISADNSNDGTINWADLLSGVGPLAPGASVQVIAKFVSIKDTGNLTNSQTINVATVSGATSDPDGPGTAPTSPTPLPDKSSQDVVEIVNPTTVLVINSQVELSDGVARLSWQTVSEANVAGFNLLRINPDGSTTRLTNPSLPAQKPGQSEGASYSWVDSSAEAGQFYTYLLEVIGLDGFTEQVTLGQLGGMRLFLPLTNR